MLSFHIRIAFGLDVLKFDNVNEILLNNIWIIIGLSLFGYSIGNISSYLNQANKNAQVTCVDPNKGMIKKCKQKLDNYKNLNWVIAHAEKLPFNENSFDFYTISFGLRNTKNLNKALTEAYRVLKPGGRFLCLEFSKIQNPSLDLFYKSYSKLIPSIGKLVVGKREPYEYLIKSIEKFINQAELINLLKKNNFEKCTYRNLSGGIVSIHSGWKV